MTIADEIWDSIDFEALLQLRRPREVQLSQDGRRIAFIVAPAAKEKGACLEARLWLGDVDGELAPAGRGGATYGVPRFSADGTELAFASDAGHPGRMSLWLHGGGELGSIDGSVEDIRWSPDGRSLLVLAADLGTASSSVASATTIAQAGASEADPMVFRAEQHWRRLFLVDAKTRETCEVTPESVNVFEFDWAGGRIAAVCTGEPSEGAWYSAWIGLIDVDARTVERVHTSQWQLQCPRISPGGRVAWIEGFASDRGLLAGTVHVLGTGALAPELDATWLAFADEQTLWYAGWRQSSSTFGRLTLDGAAHEHHGGKLLIGGSYQPYIAPSVAGDCVAAVIETVDEPPEVAVFEHDAFRAVTSFNAQLGPQLRTTQWRSYMWRSFDGLQMEGLLALPRDWKGGPLPLVVQVHGGPTWTWSWMIMPQPICLAAEGYAVFLPNPRGSVGRGQQFARASLGDVGGADLQDICAGIDALVRDGIADDSRIAIQGSSYGGFMAAWAVSQTARFAAAIACSVVTDWLSFHLTSNIGAWDQLQMQADPFDPMGDFPKRSTVYHARKCSTPTLILHGENDLCTPLGQAVELHNALVEARCETELVIYPREGHGWVEREHQLDAWRRTSAWLARHLG